VGNYQIIQPGVLNLTTTYRAPDVVVDTTDPAHQGTYRLSFYKQAGRSADTLTVSVTVPVGTVPTAWSDGGTLSGTTVTFSTTTEFDRTFEVTYATP
jgi:hypothetical protein